MPSSSDDIGCIEENAIFGGKILKPSRKERTLAKRYAENIKALFGMILWEVCYR